MIKWENHIVRALNQKTCIIAFGGLLSHRTIIVSISFSFTNFSQATHQYAFASRSIISMNHSLVNRFIQLANRIHHFHPGCLDLFAQKCFSSITDRRVKVRLPHTISSCFFCVSSYTLPSRSNICQLCNLTLVINLVPSLQFYLNEVVLSRFNLPIDI